MDHLLIIDGSSLLTTQFFGNLPKEILFEKDPEKKKKYYYKIMKTSKGVYTNAVFGFMRTLLKILKEQKPGYLAVTWDLTRDTFRRELYPDYKANRGETMEPLKDQFALCQKLLERIGVKQFMDERYEADDFSGTLAAKFEREIPVKIMTKDHDYLQLVDDRTSVWMIQTNPKKAEELFKKYGTSPEGLPDKCFEFTPELVKKEFGVEPASVNSLKGLQGDTSDNIKGVPGVGEKTAVALIAEYKTVDALYAAIGEVGEEGAKELAALWKEKLGISRSPLAYLTKQSDTELVGEKAARLSETLATIKRDIDISDVTLKSLEVSIDNRELKDAFEELEFKTLSADIEGGSDLFEGAVFTVCDDLAEAE
ncbi:MAG: DNA polymerase I, partial [Lachnospiraceae bacterium]|nr:DNA polymerase I [Lachnospiraceae bacterium]